MAEKGGKSWNWCSFSQGESSGGEFSERGRGSSFSEFPSIGVDEAEYSIIFSYHKQDE